MALTCAASIRVGQASRIGAILAAANLSDANRTHASLDTAALPSAILQDANRTDASLVSADLTRAVLRRATLVRTDLVWACLAGTDLTVAQWEDAGIACAGISGAMLNGDVLE